MQPLKRSGPPRGRHCSARRSGLIDNRMAIACRACGGRSGCRCLPCRIGRYPNHFSSSFVSSRFTSSRIRFAQRFATSAGIPVNPVFSSRVVSRMKSASGLLSTSTCVTRQIGLNYYNGRRPWTVPADVMPSTVRKTVPSIRAGRPMSPGAVPSAPGVSSGWTGAAISGTDSTSTTRDRKCSLWAASTRWQWGIRPVLGSERRTRRCKRPMTVSNPARPSTTRVPRRPDPAGASASSISNAFISRDFASRFYTWPSRVTACPRRLPGPPA